MKHAKKWQIMFAGSLTLPRTTSPPPSEISRTLFLTLLGGGVSAGCSVGRLGTRVFASLAFLTIFRVPQSDVHRLLVFPSRTYNHNSSATCSSHIAQCDVILHSPYSRRGHMRRLLKTPLPPQFPPSLLNLFHFGIDCLHQLYWLRIFICSKSY